MCILLCFAMIGPCYASSTSGDMENVPMTDQGVIDYALYFMSNSQAGRTLEVSDFLHLTDGNGQTTGYYITFTSHGTPAGYIILSLLTVGSPVVEFSFEGRGPIEASSISAGSEMLAIDAAVHNQGTGAEIIYTGADSLFIPMQTGEYLAVYQQELVNRSECLQNEASLQSTNGDVDLYDGIIDWSEANINGDSGFIIEKFGKEADYWLMNQFSSGKVCSPTAATNILWYWGFKRNRSSIANKVSAQETDFDKASLIFDLVRIGMGTDEESGTSMSKILGGYTTFFGNTSRGEWGYDEVKNGSSFDKYETLLRRHIPIHLTIRTNQFTFLGKGHDVMAMGGAESETGEKYLYVMDGWNSYGRFVKFDYYPYISGYAIVVY